MPHSTPSSERLHIGFFGRRNAGKSSLINSLSGQQVSLVSSVAGTTTDPVNRPMELLPLGPVVLIDTAGLDDEGELGELRVARSLQTIDRTDLAVIVVSAESGWGDPETALLTELKRRKLPVIAVINKADLDPAGANQLAQALRGQHNIPIVATDHQHTAPLRQAIIAGAPVGQTEVPLLADLIEPGDVVILVAPIDSAAPKGRLILPQVQAAREVLDKGAIAILVQPHELPATFAVLNRPPALVVTDSQVFAEVERLTPPEIPLTSFSILMARHKGDLPELVDGTKALSRLRPGDRVLIAETCTHHQQPDDIGTVKIPRWLQKLVGGDLQIEWAHGRDLPANLSQYQVIVHCGACMINRQLMMSRLRQAQAAGIPIVNYGVCIAYLHDILPRVLSPFPELQARLREGVTPC